MTNETAQPEDAAAVGESAVQCLVIRPNFDVDSAPALTDLLVWEDLADGMPPVLCSGNKDICGNWHYYPLRDDLTNPVIGNVIAWSEKPELGV